MSKQKRYTSDEKAIILREHIEKNIPISELAEKYKTTPLSIYKWKKLMFEAVPTNFSNNNKKLKKDQQEAEKRIAELEKLLAKREALIAELVEDNIYLKKNANGESLLNNGLSRK